MSVQRLQVRTKQRCELRDITAEVDGVVRGSGVSEGLCTIFVPHTTAGVTINENADPTVVRDILRELEKLVPFQDGYEHREGNSAAHIKASLLGASVQVPISGGRLYLGEFDGPRTRGVIVQVAAGGGA
jgi:secondary thiamine-phosphate synthase enzyme